MDMNEQNRDICGSPMQRDKWEPGAADTVREMIKNESELINHRISWMVTLQGLLFAALGFAWKDGRQLIYVIAILGIAISISTFSSLMLSAMASRSLLNDWNENKPTDYNGPDVIGYRSKAKYLSFLRPWFFLPFLFALAWISVIIINLARA
jgi:hypothetical protein